MLAIAPQNVLHPPEAWLTTRVIVGPSSLFPSPSPSATGQVTKPETLSVPRSVDGLVMVLLGGVQSLAGPVIGAGLFTWLEDAVSRNIDYWRAGLGAAVLLLVLAFPQGIAGAAARWRSSK